MSFSLKHAINFSMLKCPNSVPARIPFRSKSILVPGIRLVFNCVAALVLTIILVASPASALGTQPLVAIHDSEITRSLETIPAIAPTPSGSGTSSNQWWTTNWHYFVMPETVKESLRSDGTAFTVLGDSNIISSGLLTNGVPKYPIVVSLASEAIDDAEIAAFTNYVAAGGFLFVGSSSFTRNTNGTTRGNFAFASEMGVSMVSPALTNWAPNNNLTKQIQHRLVSHLASGELTWRLPNSAEEINYGTSPTHSFLASHDAWRVASSGAIVVAVGDALPYLTYKAYGKGYFIFYAPMQPFLSYGGYGPGMNSYSILRNAIEWAFESAKLPTVRISPWPYPYDAAFVMRHDLENYPPEIASIEASAQFEHSQGVKGDYYFCTGTFKHEMFTSYNTNTVRAGFYSAMTNYGATIASHNGGLRNMNDIPLTLSDYNFWHWGPDEVLDITPTNYPSGKDYALASLSNAFADVESWLPGLVTNGMRVWVSPYFNATREDSLDIQEQLGVKAAGEQKIGPFPHWTISTRTSNKRYPFISAPVSDWYPGGQVSLIAQSLDYHTTNSMRAAVDAFYNLGGLINIYSHVGSGGTGVLARIASDYITYSMNTNLHPRLWSANAIGIYDWWSARSNLQMTVTHLVTNGNASVTTMSVAGASSADAAVEVLLPGLNSVSAIQVLTNGVVASGSAYRTNSSVIKIVVGTSVTNVVVAYNLNPFAANDFYAISSNGNIVTPSPGVLVNDAPGLGGSNLTATLVSNVASGTLFFTNNGGFAYTPSNGFSGSDTFSYLVSDGLSNSLPATVTIAVTPPGTLFYDDFIRPPGPSSLSPWQVPSGNGTWAITNGLLQGASLQFVYGNAYISNTWTDYAVEGKVRMPAGAFGGGLGGRVNVANGAHYAAWIYPENSPGGSTVLKLMKFLSWNSWSGIPMHEVALPSVGTNWHTLKMEFQGNQIRVFYDSALMINQTDNGFSTTPAYTSGGISADLWTHVTPYSISVDDVYVTILSLEPVANNDNYTVVANTTLTISAPGVLTNDVSYTTNLSAVLASSSSHGVLSFSTNGSFVYAPDTDYIGIDSFTYQVSDGVSNSSVAAVTINVLRPNQPPVANPDGYIVAVNNTLNIAGPGVLINDADPESNSLTAQLLTVPSSGNLVLNGNGSFIYTPFTNFVGNDTFTYRASDGVTNSVPATVTIAVTSGDTLFSDDFTRTTNSASVAPWIVQAGGWVTTNGIFQGNNDSSNYAQAYIPANWTNYVLSGRVQLPAGAYGGGLAGRVNAVTGARYAAWLFPEGSGGGSNVLKLIKFQSWTEWGYLGASFVPMTVTNLPAVGTNWHTLKLAFSGNQIGVYLDGDLLISMADTEVSPNASGGIAVDMYINLTQPAMSVDNVTANQLVLAENYSVAEDNQLIVGALGVLVNDTQVHPETLGAFVVATPVHGTLTLNSNGGFNYLPSTNYTGGDSFTYRADSGTNSIGITTVNLTITPVNDAPVFVGTPANTTIAEQTLLSVTNAATDVDVPANVLSYTLINPPGNASINASGVISYTPSESEGPSTNTIRTVVSDGTVSITNSFVVVVTEVNVAPVAVNNSYLLTNTVLTVAASGVLANDTDSDLPANILTAILVSGTMNGTLSLNANGGFTYTPNNGFSGLDGFTYRANDGLANSAVAFVSITVSNRPFVITSVAISGGLAFVTWNSTPGLSYRVQYKDDLSAASWNDINPVVTSTNASSSVTNVLGSAQHRFYRVQIVPTPPPVILSLRLDSGVTVITWSSVPGKVYCLEYKMELTDTNWTEQLPYVSATGFSTSMTNSFASSSQPFYRVKCLP